MLCSFSQSEQNSNSRLERSLGVQEFRSSGVQEFRSSGVQEFRSSGVHGGVKHTVARRNLLLLLNMRMSGVVASAPELLNSFFHLPCA
jgi:hypothetical protein